MNVSGSWTDPNQAQAAAAAAAAASGQHNQLVEYPGAPEYGLPR